VEENQKPERVLGLYLLVGMVVIVIGSLGFYAITENVVRKAAIVEFDQEVGDFIHRNVTRQTAQLMEVMTLAGNEIVDSCAVALAILFAVRRRWREFTLMVVGVGGSKILVLLIKLLIQRERPIFSDPIYVAHQFSYPSGHAFWSMVFYGLLVYLVLRTSRSPVVWISVILGAVGIILLVGFTRIYLGLHFLSDVMAGYVGGLTWLLVTITGVNFVGRWRGRRRSPNDSSLVQA
jgi:membrane-associated phospholipid phosphatase